MAYQTLPSLMEYLLVAQEMAVVEAYRRANHWRVEYHDSGAIQLDCLATSVTLEEIYADVELPATPPRARFL